MTVSECRTVSDCRTVGVSDAEYDSMTLFDTGHSPSQAESVSDCVGQCRTVSECRTVGLSECRTSVGLVSECSVGMSDRGSGTNPRASSPSRPPPPRASAVAAERRRLPYAYPEPPTLGGASAARQKGLPVHSTMTCTQRISARKHT